MYRVPNVRRDFARAVTQPPDMTPKPKEGAFKYDEKLLQWRLEIDNNKLRLNPVLRRFRVVQLLFTILQYSIIAYNVFILMFDWFRKNVPYIEPLRFGVSYILFLLWQFFMPILIRRTGKRYYADTEQIMPIEIIRQEKEEDNDEVLKKMEESKLERPETNEDEVIIPEDEFNCDIPGLTSKDLKRLRKSYKKIDVDDSESISKDEFISWIGVTHAEKFINKCFSALDVDHDSDISFEEFVVQTFKICILDRDHLIQFAFDLYDADKSELIDRGELEDMFDEMYGEESFKVFNLIDIIDKDGNGIVTFQEFFDCCRKHSQMLRPAFGFQRELQIKSLGSVKVWKEIKKRHDKLKVSAGAT